MGLAATTRVPMGAQVPVLSLNHHPNPSQGRQKGFRKRRISEILQVSLNSLHNGNFGAFGGPWLGLYGLGSHYVGPRGCSSTCIVTKSSPKPIPGATEGFPKKANFWKSCRCHQTTLSSVKTAKSSLARAHRGGATGGTWSSDPGPPPWVRGSMYKKKVAPDLGPNPHTPPRKPKKF